MEAKWEKVFKEGKSYSRLYNNGIFYPLNSEFFAREVDGNLICTDMEMDIGCDGNICLVTPEGDVIHIGEMPMPERGKVDTRFLSNGNLRLQWIEYCDCDHKHPDLQVEVIDTHMTDERKVTVKTVRLYNTLSSEMKKTDLELRLSEDSEKKAKIFCCARRQVRKRGRYGFYNSTETRRQALRYDTTSGKFVLEEGEESVLDFLQVRTKDFFEKKLAEYNEANFQS